MKFPTDLDEEFWTRNDELAMSSPAHPPMMNPVIIPSAAAQQPPTASLAAVINDDRAIAKLVSELLNRANLRERDVWEKLGIKQQSFSQYRSGRRRNPSVKWLARLVALCGGRLLIEFPTQQK